MVFIGKPGSAVTSYFLLENILKLLFSSHTTLIDCRSPPLCFYNTFNEHLLDSNVELAKNDTTGLIIII